MIWYRARWEDVEPVNVERETDKFVIFTNLRGLEIKELKISEHQSYHKSPEEAFQYLRDKRLKEIEKYKSWIKICEEKIDEINKNEREFNNAKP